MSKRIIVYLSIIILIACVLIVHFLSEREEVPRCSVKVLADVVNVGNQRIRRGPDKRSIQGWKLSYTLNEFLIHYPDARSHITWQEPVGNHLPERLSFFVDLSFPELCKIWDAPLYVKWLMKLHGSGLCSDVPFVHRNPVLDRYDLECIPLDGMGYTWKERDGSHPRTGCYLLKYGCLIIELREKGWAIMTRDDSIYRLRTGHFYVPYSAPQRDDWELVYEHHGKNYQAKELPFGTYLFYHQGRQEGGMPVSFLYVLSVTPSI